MIAGLLCIAALFAPEPASAPAHAAPPAAPVAIRPVATYSIVARDSASGEMGVAVQSHWFSVGPIVPWAEAGVGAVATQSLVEVSYGPLGLELMRHGRSAPEALRALVETDEGRDLRQVAMVDAEGRVAAYTGARAIQAAGHQSGPGYSVQANLMERASVWDAMAEAYDAAEGDLAERLLQALEAAEREGGDIRGKQSAALLIVAPESTGRPWVDRRFDLRVEDHPDPVGELRRLVTLQRAYLALNAGDEALGTGDVEGALAAYRRATEIVPDAATNGEAAFWTGVTLVGIDRVDDAIPFLRRAYAADARWAETIRRLPASGLFPDDASLLERVVAAMRGG